MNIPVVLLIIQKLENCLLNHFSEHKIPPPKPTGSVRATEYHCQYYLATRASTKALYTPNTCFTFI